MSLVSRIAFTIIIAGLFVVTAFVAVFHDVLAPGFYAVLIPVIGFLFFFAFAIGQHVARPLRKMLKEIAPLQQGNGQTRVYLKTADEIGQLAKTFNVIAGKFEEHRSNLETLTVNAQLRTRALQEVIDSLEHKVHHRTTDWQKAEQELERSHLLLNVKNKEILDLHHRLAKLEKKSKKKK